METISSEEVEPINLAIPAFEARFSKIGPAVRPSHITGWDTGRLSFAQVSYGHATQGTAQLSDEHVVVAVATRTGPGERWDGKDIGPGHVVVYGPGALHTSTSPAGVGVRLLVVELEALRESSDALGRELKHVQSRVLWPSEAARWVALCDELSSASSGLDPRTTEPSILHAMIHASSPPPRPARRLTRAELSDRRIVATALDYLDAIGRWTAPMLGLCEIIGASERRLEAAFLAIFGVPPSVFLRNRALSVARSRLLAASGPETTVSRVALDHGFNHFGRFSGYYRVMYGESPSTTLHSPTH